MTNKVDAYVMSDMDETGKECRFEGKEDVLDILKDSAVAKQIELIHTALKNNNFNTGRMLIGEGLTTGTGVDRKGADGRTALHIVTASNSPHKLDMIKWLITEHNADPNIHDKAGKSALQVAIDLKEDDTVLVFLQSGMVEQKESLVFATAQLNGSGSLEFLLNGSHELLKTTDTLGETVLHVAVEKGVVQSVELILKHNQDLVKEHGRLGRQAIHVAAQRGDLDVMRLLLENGASPNTPSPQGSPLCIATQKGHEALISYLLNIEDIDIHLTNDQGDTALHLAVRGSHRESCRLLLQHPEFPVTKVNCSNQTVLHYIAQFATHKDWEPVVDELIQKGVGCLHQDAMGQTALHTAIAHNNQSIVKHFITLLQQEPDSLVQALQIHDKKHQTPFRGMIKTMPGLAREILDTCIRLSQDSGITSLHFDFSLLEDTFDTCDEEGHLAQDAKPYCKNYSFMRANHPLNIIARKEKHELLAHPVLKLLLHRKWTWASTLYIYFILFYAAHVVSVSVYMITASPPFQVNQSWCEAKLADDLLRNLWNEEGQGSLQTGLTAAVCTLAACGIISELVQLVLSGTSRLTDIHNILDWFTFISAILITIDFTECKTRTNWQWQLGVACVFIAWMNFLFYLRKAPKIGIYIAMIGMIFKTFMQFFAVFFLFILAFAITYYLLLQNQYAFRDVFVSILKTWVMMIGEIDFTDIFHSYHEDGSHEVQVYFPEITYMVFIVSLMLLSLIIMNLLTGLAIRDVNKLLEDSLYQVTAMQITLALDIEFANPVWCHRKIVRRKETLQTGHRVNGRFGRIRGTLAHFFYGPLSAKRITAEAMSIVSRNGEGEQPSGQGDHEDTMRNMQEMMRQLRDKVNTLEQRHENKR